MFISTFSVVKRGFEDKSEAEKYTLKTLEFWNMNTFEFFSLLGIAFNSCLCLDLFLTYKEPFYPIARRIKIYMIGSVLFAFIMSIYA